MIKEILYALASGGLISTKQLIVSAGFMVALWCAGFSRWRSHVVSSLFGALLVLAFFASIWLLSTSLIYLSFGGYYDHAEATVASLSWLLHLGDQPLYHDLHSAYRYSLSYGPMLYLLNVLPPLVLGAGIATSKISGIVACALAVLVLFRTLIRNCELRLALILIGLFALLSLIFRNYAYWNRPDPFLALCVAVGLSKVSTSSLRSAAIYVGVTTGVALNLKIHGAVYMLPVIALFLMRRPRRYILLVALSVLVVVFMVPFLLPQISLAEYMLSLSVAVRHGLSFSMFVQSIEFLLIMLTPLIGFILIGSSRESSPKLDLLAAAFIVELIVITIISSKHGAGAHHFLPVLPTLIYICSLILCGQGQDEWLARIRDLKPAFAGFLLLATSSMTIASIAMSNQISFVERLAARDRAINEAALDLVQILTQYSGSSIQMGYSDWANAEFTYLRPLVVARGNPYWLDAATLMDYDANGIGITAGSLEWLETCKTEVWILPANGQPFSMKNYYSTGRNIFGDKFGPVFLERYALVQWTKYFGVWMCRSGQT